MTRLPTFLRPLFPVAKKGFVLATQAVSPVTRRLPAWGTRPGPPRHVARTVAAYAESHREAGIEIDEVVPALTIDRDMPEGRPAEHWVFEAHRHEVIAPNVVCRIHGGRVIGIYGAVATPDDTLLFDLSPYWDVDRPSQHPIYLSPRLPAVQQVRGSVAVLTTRAEENYYHWLTDVLPRLSLLEHAGVRPDHYFVSRATRFQREMLDHLGIGEEVCLESTELLHVEADTLIVPSVPDDDLRTPPWIVPWLRAHFLTERSHVSPTRRLYVTRGQKKYSRRVENEEELMAALSPLGFELIDTGAMSVAEQVAAFAEARLIVSAHGAGLTNLAFCSPGAAVVEMFPTTYVNPCFWRLATAVAGLTYRYLVGSGDQTLARSNRSVAADVHAEISHVTGLIHELI